MQLSCPCSNLTLHLTGTPEPLENAKLLRSASDPSSSVFSKVGKGLLGLGGITQKLEYLTSTSRSFHLCQTEQEEAEPQQQQVMAKKCLGCNMWIYAVSSLAEDKEKKRRHSMEDGSSLKQQQEEVWVDLALVELGSQMKSIEEDPSYSPCFRLLLSTNSELRAPSPTFLSGQRLSMHPDAYLLEQHVQTYITKQTQLMEERIKEFIEKEKQQLKELENRANEDKLLVLSLHLQNKETAPNTKSITEPVPLQKTQSSSQLWMSLKNDLISTASALSERTHISTGAGFLHRSTDEGGSGSESENNSPQWVRTNSGNGEQKTGNVEGPTTVPVVAATAPTKMHLPSKLFEQRKANEGKEKEKDKVTNTTITKTSAKEKKQQGEGGELPSIFSFEDEELELDTNENEIVDEDEDEEEEEEEEEEKATSREGKGGVRMRRLHTTSQDTQNNNTNANDSSALPYGTSLPVAILLPSLQQRRRSSGAGGRSVTHRSVSDWSDAVADVDDGISSDRNSAKFIVPHEYSKSVRPPSELDKLLDRP